MSSFEFQWPALDLALHEEFSPALLVDDPSFGFAGASVLHHRRLAAGRRQHVPPQRRRRQLTRVAVDTVCLTSTGNPVKNLA